jgi:hypothetical protein
MPTPDEERHAPQDDLATSASAVSPRGVQPRPELFRIPERNLPRTAAQQAADELARESQLTEYREPDGTTHKMREDGLAVVITADDDNPDLTGVTAE